MRICEIFSIFYRVSSQFKIQLFKLECDQTTCHWCDYATAKNIVKKRMRCAEIDFMFGMYISLHVFILNQINFLVALYSIPTLLYPINELACIKKYRYISSFHVFDVMSFYSSYIDEQQDPLYLYLYTSLNRKKMFQY